MVRVLPWLSVAGARDAFFLLLQRGAEGQGKWAELVGRRVILGHATSAMVAVALSALSRPSYAEDYQLPPEVTPQIKAACETDVRRLCIGTNPTISKVKICVASKFLQLGRRCQVQLALAGFKP